MADSRDPWDDDDSDGSAETADGQGLFAALGPGPWSQPSGDADDPEDEEALFVVQNPAGTVSVTTFLSGTVQRVHLAPTVTRMTERELADEVLVIADLARQQAQSVLHTFVTQTMGSFGHDTASLSAGLSRDLGMPTPAHAADATARVFASRYSGDLD